jgi:hypothetical protein
MGIPFNRTGSLPDKETTPNSTATEGEIWLPGNKGLSSIDVGNALNYHSSRQPLAASVHNLFRKTFIPAVLPLCSESACLRFPTSSQSFVENNQADKFIGAILRQREFRGIEGTLCNQHFQISSHASAVTIEGKLHGFLEVFHTHFPEQAHLLQLLISNQPIRDFAKSTMDGLLIIKQEIGRASCRERVSRSV